MILTISLAMLLERNPAIHRRALVSRLSNQELPLEESLQQAQAKEIARLKQLRYYKLVVCYNNNVVRRALKWMVSKLMFWTSIYKINDQMDKVMRKYNDQDSGYICSMASHYSYKKQCMPKEIYGTPTAMPFEDRAYWVPEQCEAYLTRIYGDYMKLPPENERTQYMDRFTGLQYEPPVQGQ